MVTCLQRLKNSDFRGVFVTSPAHISASYARMRPPAAPGPAMVGSTLLWQGQSDLRVSRCCGTVTSRSLRDEERADAGISPHPCFFGGWLLKIRNPQQCR